MTDTREIPAGKVCGECLLGVPDPEMDTVYGCRLFNEYALFPWYETEHGKRQVKEAQRCSQCLAAYPYGGTISITPNAKP